MSAHYYSNMRYLLCSIYGIGAFNSRNEAFLKICLHMVTVTAKGKKTEYFGLHYVGKQCLDSTMATCYKMVLFFNGDCTMARNNGMLLQLLFN